MQQLDIKIFTENIDGATRAQVFNMAKSPVGLNQKIRIMPDCHAGKGCVIGTTMTMGDKVVPNIVGVDIGCGMLTVKLKDKDIDLSAFDTLVHNKVPHGTGTHNVKKSDFDLTKLKMYKELDRVSRLEHSIGSLGSGNHFIELAQDKDGYIYLIIHSGSRNLGQQVAKFYQNLAQENIRNLITEQIKKLKETIVDMTTFETRKQEIYNTFKVDKELAFLSGDGMQDYLHDMAIVQDYAVENRKVMADILLKDLHEVERFETIHNYIDLKKNIVRKGAISAEAGELCLIPINMRDGSLLCRGKGNPDWNYSAPHGAGRILSRHDAKQVLVLDEFKEQMSGVYSTTVSKNTLDEAPDAYKPMAEIVENIADTVEILDILTPIYNFKSS